MKNILILCLLIIGSQAFTQTTIIGGAGVCHTFGDPDLNDTLESQDARFECLVAVDTSTATFYLYDKTASIGSRWNVVSGGGADTRVDTAYISDDTLRLVVRQVNDLSVVKTLKVAIPIPPTDLTFTGTTSPITLNSSTGSDVIFKDSTGTYIRQVANTLTILNTGDLSSTNELQTISIVGNDVTLSNGGGTVTVPNYAAGTGISITGTTPNFTINSTGVSGSGLANRFAIFTASGAIGSESLFRVDTVNSTMAFGGAPTSYTRQFNYGLGTTSSTYGLIVTPSGGATGTASLAVADNGNVGIGTNAPNVKLHVTGEIRAGTGLYVNSGTSQFSVFGNGQCSFQNTASGTAGYNFSTPASTSIGLQSYGARGNAFSSSETDTFAAVVTFLPSINYTTKTALLLFGGTDPRTLVSAGPNRLNTELNIQWRFVDATTPSARFAFKSAEIAAIFTDTLNASKDVDIVFRAMQANTFTEQARFKDGRFGVGTDAPTSKVHIDGANGYTQLRLIDSYTPSATGDSNGAQGDVAWDDDYIYIKTSAGWKRSALSTF